MASVLKDKSYAFAVQIVQLYQSMVEEKLEFVLSKQLLRSGTSVGAMVREAEHAQSKADFIHKLSIAQKEINESIYWLELLHETKYLEQKKFNNLNENAIELIKIITSSIKTSKSNLNNR